MQRSGINLWLCFQRNQNIDFIKKNAGRLNQEDLTKACFSNQLENGKTGRTGNL